MSKPTSEGKNTSNKKPTTRDVGNTESSGGPIEKSALVEKMLQTFRDKVESKQIKLTAGDFIRLIQLQKELEEEQPKEIRVTWVEPTEEESVSGT